MWTAEATIFIAVARILSVFKITKAVDDDGNTLEPKVGYGTGMIRYVKPQTISIGNYHSRQAIQTTFGVLLKFEVNNISTYYESCLPRCSRRAVNLRLASKLGRSCYLS